MHSLRCILSLYTSHHVTCDVSHATLILFLPDVGHINVGPGYMLQCICVHMLQGLATTALGGMGLAPLKCNLSVLFKIQELLGFSHRLKTPAHADTQKEQLQRASHEAICLVPGSVDKYLPVPNCNLQKEPRHTF